MPRFLRRLLLLALVVVVAAMLIDRRRRATIAQDPPEWPPFETPRHVPEPVTEEAAPARWVDPVDGECPLDHPVKANDNSGIFHVPGGRFYDRTRAERCYARVEDAEADGYRASKA